MKMETFFLSLIGPGPTYASACVQCLIATMVTIQGPNLTFFDKTFRFGPFCPFEIQSLTALFPTSDIFDVIPLVDTTLNHKVRLYTSKSRVLSPLYMSLVDALKITAVGAAVIPDLVRHTKEFERRYQSANKATVQAVFSPKLTTIPTFWIVFSSRIPRFQISLCGH